MAATYLRRLRAVKSHVADGVLYVIQYLYCMQNVVW
jgi:hypothetical protein